MLSSHYKFFPTELSRLHIALFDDVKNAAELRARLVKASTMEGEEGEKEREAVNFGFVDAAPIASLLHLQTAIQQATLACTDGSMKTKTVHSEILWALNSGSNIGEAIKRFGVSDTTKSLFAVRVCGPELSIEQVLESMKAVIQGEEVPFEKLDEMTDWDRVIKYYHNKSKGSADEEVTKLMNQKPLSDKGKRVINEIVVSSVAMKTVMA
ncbi:kinase domain protein [Ceratobasidium sp. AG-Ba]|nr:kinase domain protein [Ceratobasidium sp. AG-Ba]QRW01453.1 kinase domain protein [Ceratobasidium sp. AG-Ba]